MRRLKIEVFCGSSFHNLGFYKQYLSLLKKIGYSGAIVMHGLGRLK